MATIVISDELYARVHTFKSVFESVIQEQVPDDDFPAVLLESSLRLMLAEILPRDPEVLVTSMQGLAARHPDQVYGFVADVLAGGEGGSDSDAIRNKIGFKAAPPR